MAIARRTGITLLEVMCSIGTPIGRKRPSHKIWIVVCQKMRLNLVMPCQILLIRGRPLASSVNAAIEGQSVKARVTIQNNSLPKHHENIKRPCRKTAETFFFSAVRLVARARFCHYFSASIRIPFSTEKCKFFNKTKSFPKILAKRA